MAVICIFKTVLLRLGCIKVREPSLVPSKGQAWVACQQRYQSLDIGFLEFSDENEALMCMHALNGQVAWEVAPVKVQVIV